MNEGGYILLVISIDNLKLRLIVLILSFYLLSVICLNKDLCLLIDATRCFKKKKERELKGSLVPARS
jgi:hypothetical protein